MIAFTPSGRKRGVVAVLIMLLWFWDLPVAGYYKYKCATEGGFEPYKSVEQWKRENPGVAKTLVAYERSIKTVEGEVTRYQRNQRFAMDAIHHKLPFLLEKREERAVDTHTADTLARHIDFASGNKKYEW